MSDVPGNIESAIFMADIFVGKLFEMTPLGFTTDDGTAIADYTDIQARLEFRDRPGGELITSMATAGGGDADGTIEVIEMSDTSVALVVRLDAADTEGLVPVYDTATRSVALAGVGQLEVWGPEFVGGQHMPGAWYHLRIWPEVAE